MEKEKELPKKEEKSKTELELLLKVAELEKEVEKLTISNQGHEDGAKIALEENARLKEESAKIHKLNLDILLKKGTIEYKENAQKEEKSDIDKIVENASNWGVMEKGENK